MWTPACFERPTRRPLRRTALPESAFCGGDRPRHRRHLAHGQPDPGVRDQPGLVACRTGRHPSLGGRDRFHPGCSMRVGSSPPPPLDCRPAGSRAATGGHRFCPGLTGRSLLGDRRRAPRPRGGRGAGASSDGRLLLRTELGELVRAWNRPGDRRARYVSRRTRTRLPVAFGQKDSAPKARGAMTMDFRIFIAIGASVALPGCSPSEEPVSCAQDLQATTATVVNQVGQPLDGIQVTDTVRRTGAVLLLVDQTGSLPARGRAIPVFTNAFLRDVRPEGNEVVVLVIAGGHSGTGLFRFGPRRCEVQKLAGPDSLTVS